MFGICVQVNLLWSNQPIQDAFLGTARKCEYTEALRYAIANLDRIVKPDWTPTNDDVLHIRQRTTGLTETHFQVRERPMPPFRDTAMRQDVWPGRCNDVVWMRQDDSLSPRKPQACEGATERKSTGLLLPRCGAAKALEPNTRPIRASSGADCLIHAFPTPLLLLASPHPIFTRFLTPLRGQHSFGAFANFVQT